jgi:hypothetical protein
MTTPNEIGRKAEEKVASLQNGRLVPGSGSGKFVVLDVTDSGGFVFSVKATKSIKQSTLRMISKLWNEAVHGARGFNGHGDGAKPGCVFDLDGESLVMVRLEDFAELATGEAEPYVPSSKAADRRARSRASLL